jgi:pimeloyl-ACP methyl ester carboxylesterase
MIDGVAIRYDTSDSPGDADDSRWPAVYVHGLHSSMEHWTRHAAQVSSRQTVRIDLQSHGQSALPTAANALTVEAYAETVVGVVRAIDCRKVHLVGNSVGAWVVALMASQCPELTASVVMVGMGARPSARLQPGIYEVDDGRGVRAIMEPRIGDVVRTRVSPADVEMVLRVMDEATPALAAERVRQSQRFTFESADIDIRCPALAVVGDRDPIALLPDVAALRDTIEHIQISVLPDCGHLPHLEEPFLFDFVIDRFLAEVEARTKL